MGERSLELHEEDLTCSDPRFADLTDEWQANVLRAFGLAELNPKTIVCFHLKNGRPVLEMRQMLSREPSRRSIGLGETLYSKEAA